MQIIQYENEHFIVAYKAHSLPTVPLKQKNDTQTLLDKVGAYCPAVLEKMSEKYWEGGVIHRLDTDTEGLVLIAKTKEFFSFIRQVQKNNLFFKHYIAKCNHISIKKTSESASAIEKFDRSDKNLPFQLSTYFRAFGPGRKRVKVETDIKHSDNGILYTTTIEKVKEDNNIFTFNVTITQGFRHQIRAHLSYLNYPICNDRLYNNLNVLKNENLLLKCTALDFPFFDKGKFIYSL